MDPDDEPLFRATVADYRARRFGQPPPIDDPHTEETAVTEPHRSPPGWDVEGPQPGDDDRPEAPDPADGGHPPDWPAAAHGALLGGLPWPEGLPAPGQIEDHLSDVVRTPDPSLLELRGHVDQLDAWLRERGA